MKLVKFNNTIIIKLQLMKSSITFNNIIVYVTVVHVQVTFCCSNWGEPERAPH